jgi:hypothetical protein
MTGPVNRHGQLIGHFASGGVNIADDADKPTILDWCLEMRERLDKAAAGDLTLSSELLAAQALTLDGLFTDLMRRAANNMDAGYLQAFDVYMRQALKAQTASRQAIEALARLHQPREQTVRHVHVHEGGQAVVAEEFHAHHPGGVHNGEVVIQSHGPDAPAPSGAPLLGQDASGHALPVPSDERPATVPAARRQGRRSEGQ